MKVKGIVWLGTRTLNFDARVSLYRDILGLEIVHQQPGFAVINLPNGDRVEVFGEESSYNTFFTNPVAAFLVEDRTSARLEMESAGIELIGDTGFAEDGNAWAHFRAPDGFISELNYVPNHNPRGRPMQKLLSDFSATHLVKRAVKENWENYHYCLGRSPSVELSIGRYLTWFITNVPDHFMNLVVCTQLPSQGTDELIESAFAHFRTLQIRKMTWLVEEGVPEADLRTYLLEHGLRPAAAGTEMAADLTVVPDDLPAPNGLEVVRVEDPETLRQWIHVATLGFGVPAEFEQVWYDFFVEAVFDQPFWTYLALLHGEPVGTSQLFLSAGVAGIYNVTCLPQARGQGIGSILTQAPLLDARAIGYRIGILQASSLGYPVYRRLGFQDFGRLSVYLWENPS